jgi:general stress protein 26
MTSPDAIIQLRELIGDARVAMVTTRALEGELHSRPLTLAEINDQGAAVFLVDNSTDWVRGLTAGEPVNLAFAHERSQTWVSVSGTATISDDRAAMHRLWSKPAEAFFPDGIETPELRLLMVQGRSAEYWDAPSSRVLRLALMAGALIGNTRAPMGESGTIEL